MKNILRITMAALLCILCSGGLKAAGAAGTHHAYLLDTGGLTDVEELYLVGTMQGVVNRDAPRLFLTAVDKTFCAGDDNVYVDYLEKEKGFTFTRLKSLAEVVSTFAAMKRADGVTPLIKGMVKYPTKGYFNNWIAANFAAQEDLLPVTDNILQYKTSMLSGSEFWYKDDSMKGGWAPMRAVIKRPATGGIKIESRPGIKEGSSGAAARWVYLDLDKTPKVEVVVSDLTPGATWSLGIKMPTTVKTMENCSMVKLPELTNIDHAGTFVVDLAASGLFNPRSARAGLIISPSGKGASVTVQSIRFLDAKGEDPKTPPYVPPKNVFDGLAVTRDLTTNAPYAQNEEAACEWSLANQRKQCEPDSFGSFAAGAWILKGLDYAIAKKSYLFYQNKEAFVNDGYPNLEKILADLKPPGIVYGWLGGESYACMKMGTYGARYAGGPSENFSFWQWVPLKKPGQPITFPQVREVKGLENKTYLNFSWASCDAIQFSYDLMEGFWQDPNRGKVPMTWGFSPLMGRFAPAIVEFYAHSATPKDSFWGFTAGYTHPSCFSPENLKLYAEDTRQGLHDIGISPAVDLWDCAHNSHNYEELSKESPSLPGVKLISVTPSAHGPETFWLENGTAVVRNDQRFHGKSQKNGKTTIQSILTGVKEIEEQYPGRDPKFLTINTRVSPTFVMELQALLPTNVMIVGMPDFIGLAQESGAVVAVPFSDSIGAGDSIKVSFQLHNASGATGGAGRVFWTMPPGWTASPAEWSHGPVPLGSNLKQTVTFTPPQGIPNGKVTIHYKDSRFGWDKEFSLTTYPKGTTVTDCESVTGWNASGGASVAIDQGMIGITPKTSRTRADYFTAGRVPENNGRLTFPLQKVDFSGNPQLKINIADQDGPGTVIGLLDEKGQWKKCAVSGDTGTVSIDLAKVTKLNGVKDVTLTLDPLTHFGSHARIRSIKLCYP